jgi:pyrroloquinoline quinone (PQQ) biosynthesis protein C
MNTPDDLDYFRVLIEADQEHSRVERELLQSTLNEEAAPSVKESVDTILDSLRNLLSAVCHHHGIEC